MHIQHLGPVRAYPLCSESISAIGRSAQNDVLLIRLDRGFLSLNLADRQLCPAVGDWIIFDASFHNSFRTAEGFVGLCVRVPKERLATRIATLTDFRPHDLTNNSPMGSLACRLISESLELRLSGDSGTAWHLANAIIDALAAALNDSIYVQGPETNGRGASQLERAKSIMLAGLDDPLLNIDLVAGQVGVSRRTLNRLFNAEQTTPTRWLWAQRLERSKVMLEARQDIRVTDVALNCGFSDFSHFSRVFKSRFGVTPRSLLAAADE
ncbi:helix-turn-helix transcriptional regulator [Oceanobacter mangrovi]|uniref:helix-turn-helix transcriptional regulator n=1 Tax=Oceanobacter mangrovi TaxID=2862510 RepID=UPI001C8E3496|nr:helix-turn-helix transcriptional regulator [Oceanobacter mangrovi]